MTFLIRNKLDIFKEFLIGILHGLVFLPVLYYALNLNRVPGIQSLVVFFILTQVMAVAFSKWRYYFLVQAGLILAFLYILFPLTDQVLSVMSWPRETWGVLADQWTMLLASELVEVPMLLLTTMLFLLITLVTHLTIHIKLAFPSFLISFVYLMLVHTFSANRIFTEMIQLIGFGFLFIAFMQLDSRTTWTHFMKSVLLTSVFTFCLVGISSWAVNRLRPTQEWLEVRTEGYQKELDDRGVFEWINSYRTGFGFRRTGFGVDDSRLGGPLRQDFTPLFNAYTSDPHYWKVMHRNEYTGSGWETQEDEVSSRVFSPYNPLIDFTPTSAERENMVSDETISMITIQWIDDLSYITYPYGWYDLDIDTGVANYDLQRHDFSDFYSIDTESEDVTDYVVTYNNDFPSRFDEELLRMDDGWRESLSDLHEQRVNEDPYFESDPLVNEEIMAIWFENELQLPPDLPQRIIDLAEELTEDLDSEYEKVRAIEQYLKEDGGYRYSLLEVENTPEGGDYVDHFLFESKIGYCNNFSSAMTVMLRAVGIPARWSKGFTPGSQYTDEYGETFFQVTNSNAHSWTEVFFLSHGWVPFEPSPSFANPMTNPEPVATVGGETYSFEEEDFIDLEEASDSETPLDQEDTQEEVDSDPLEEDTNEEALETDIAIDESDSESRWSFIISFTSLTFMIILIFLVIFRWKVMIQLSKFLTNKNLLSAHQACSLVLLLFSFRQKRMSGQTIELYLEQWKPFAPQHYKEIDDFTALADSVFYGRSDDKHKHLSRNQKTIVTSILSVLYDLPSLKQDPIPPHPLSGNIKQDF